MIHGVVLEVLEHGPNVRHLRDHQAIAVNQFPGAAQEILCIVHVRKHVVPDDRPRGPPFCAEPPACFTAEEITDGFDAVRARDRGNIRGRFDTGGPDDEGLKTTKQTAGVAGNWRSPPTTSSS